MAGIREAYRRQKRVWLWMMSLSLVSSAILMGRASSLALTFAFVCLGLGLYLVWNFSKCVRAIRMIDKSLAPYHAGEEERNS